MKEETYPRLLPITGAYNLRDLGGYEAADGKHVKWKTLLRSGDLHQLTAEDLDYLAAIPLKTDIDFRGKTEKETAADKTPSTLNQYIPLPIEAGNMSDMQHIDASKLPNILEDVYAYIIKNAQTTYKLFFQILTDEKSAPLLFHCSAGKDRTGIAAALLLAALGVDKETIMKDYLLSAEYIKGKYDFLTDKYPQFAPLTTVKKEYLEAALNTIDKEFGGMESYLTNNLGADLKKLRKLYTE